MSRFRPFVGEFLLPLVRGGKIHVGRPLGARELGALVTRWAASPSTPAASGAVASTEDSASVELGWRRAVRARCLMAGADTPPLDATTLRLGAAMHNILSLTHPGLSAPAQAGARQQIVESTADFAEIGPPTTAAEAVNRHTLLARVPDIMQTDHLLSLWFGRRRYVGRTPPSRFLEGWRQVDHDSVDRVWLREIGVPPVARGLWSSLHRANPLAEALDPLRLDPSLSWDRILPVLRFPALARLVASRALELGASAAGNAFVGALHRFAASRPGLSRGPRAGDIAFAVRFVCHVFWLHHVFVGKPDELSAGVDFAALVAAASQLQPALARPRDLDSALTQPLVARVTERLAALQKEARASAPERWNAALGLCRLAANELNRPGGAGAPAP